MPYPDPNFHHPPGMHLNEDNMGPADPRIALYQRIVDVGELPPPTAPPGDEILLEIMHNTRVRLAGTGVTLKNYRLFAFNALVTHREKKGATIEELAEYGPGGQTPTAALSKAVYSLSTRFRNISGREVIAASPGTPPVYRLNPHVVLLDRRLPAGTKTPEASAHSSDLVRREYIITELVKRYKDLPAVHRMVESFRNPAAPPIEDGPLPKDVLQQHFMQMQRYRLLEKGEHRTLFRKIEAGLEAYDTSMMPYGGVPNAEQEQACIDLVAAFESLTVTSLRLATSVARQYKGLPLADLVQEASIGLRRGLCRFDHTLGYEPSTYLICWIRMAVSRAVSKNVRLVKVTEDGQRIDTARRKLSKRLGREPSIQEISDHTGQMSKVIVNTLASMSTLSEGLVYLDAAPFDSLNMAPELIVGEANSPEEDTQRAQVRSLFEQPELSDDAKLVLALRTGTLRNAPDELSDRFGKRLTSDEALSVSLARNEPLSNREVARILGITFVREKELYTAALQAARALLTVGSEQP